MESFSKVYDHPLISEIVIVDDHSDLYLFTQLYNAVSGMKKIKLFRNQENLGMSRNKAEAISKASNELCIIFDSDNILYPEYLDSIPITTMQTMAGNVYGHKLDETIIYCPEIAEPDYDYSDLPATIDKANARIILYKKEFRTFLNICNYLVNREKYLEVYRYNPEIKESDTVWFNYLWLKAGYSFCLVPGMKYFHRKHEGSGWLMGEHKYNMKKADEIQELIKHL